MTNRAFGFSWRCVVVALLFAVAAPGAVTSAQSHLGWTGRLDPGLAAVQDRASPQADDAATGVADDPLSTAAVAPAETLIYAAITTDPASEQLTLAEELTRRAGLGDLLDQAQAEIAADLAAESDLNFAALGGGEAAIVVTGFRFAEDDDSDALPIDVAATPAPAEVGAQGIAIVISAEDPDAAAAVAEQIVEDEATQRDQTVEEIEQGDVSILVSPPDQFGTGGMAAARLDDLVVLAPTLADIEPLVDVAAEPATSLAESESFTRASQELEGDFLAYSFVNGPAIRKVVAPLVDEAGAQGDLGVDPGQALAGLGIDTDQALAGLDVYTASRLWADAPGFRLDTITVPVAGTTLPAAPVNFDTTLDERVPADTLLFVNGSDLGPTVAPALDSLVVLGAQAAAADPTGPLPISPAGLDVDDPMAIYGAVSRVLAFNPRTDLIDQLVGEWAFALWARSTEDPGDIGAVFVSGVEDEARLTDATTKLAVWTNLLVIGLLSEDPEGDEILLGEAPVGASVEEVEGALTQVVDIPIPDLGTTVRLQWGIVDGQFIYSINGDFAEAAVGPDASLATNPRYQAAMGELPAEHFAAVYLDVGQVIALVEQALAQQGADPETLPDLSAIQAFAAVSFQRDDVQGASAILVIDEG